MLLFSGTSRERSDALLRGEFISGARHLYLSGVVYASEKFQEVLTSSGTPASQKDMSLVLWSLIKASFESCLVLQTGLKLKAVSLSSRVKELRDVLFRSASGKVGISQSLLLLGLWPNSEPICSRLGKTVSRWLLANWVVLNLMLDHTVCCSSLPGTARKNR